MHILPAVPHHHRPSYGRVGLLCVRVPGSDLAGWPMSDYEAFLRAKIRLGERSGMDLNPAEVNPALKPFTQVIVRWALAGGRRAIFASFGLHKTCAQLEIMRLIGGETLRLIGLPLGVRQEFFHDAATFFQGQYSVTLKFIRTNEEIEGPDAIYLTNYESTREGKIDPSLFGAVSLDEASLLRSFGS